VAGEGRIELDVPLDEIDDPAALRARVARLLKRSPDSLPSVSIARRAIDARGRRVRFHVSVDLSGASLLSANRPPLREVSGEPVIIVGDGPAGLFCAHELARAGIASIVLDRGKTVQPRRHDLAALQKKGVVDPDSNYCFGEGGAGTYSDGKLYTRADKRGEPKDVLETLAENGAPEDILVDARPHIGSNKLPRVVTSMRVSLENVGVRFEMGARVVRLLASSGRVRGVELADGRTLEGRAVVLATGHSARDVFEMLLAAGVPLEPKPFALGVRIEHPQGLVNRAQYGADADHPKLPNAYYRLAETIDVGNEGRGEGRGVFSFCMCPGGWIVPASTEPDGLVVNGMSLSRRDSPFANSGLVIAIEPHDWERAGFTGPLGGVALQRAIERAACAAGGGAMKAPATRASDFLAGRASQGTPETSYIPGLTPGDVGAVLDASGLPLAERLRRALRVFDRRLRGYASSEAVLVATESRTSAPVRTPRDPKTLEAVGLAHLYPCGEGAGYAGGIVSAALDGIRVAQAIRARG
jgi:uncharacterized FAD-dependent dehydrogenase